MTASRQLFSVRQHSFPFLFSLTCLSPLACSRPEPPKDPDEGPRPETFKVTAASPMEAESPTWRIRFSSAGRNCRTTVYPAATPTPSQVEWIPTIHVHLAITYTGPTGKVLVPVIVARAADGKTLAPHGISQDQDYPNQNWQTWFRSAIEGPRDTRAVVSGQTFDTTWEFSFRDPDAGARYVDFSVEFADVTPIAIRRVPRKSFDDSYVGDRLTRICS
jgi:hypothetical protein